MCDSNEILANICLDSTDFITMILNKSIYNREKYRYMFLRMTNDNTIRLIFIGDHKFYVKLFVEQIYNNIVVTCSQLTLNEVETIAAHIKNNFRSKIVCMILQ